MIVLKYWKSLFHEENPNVPRGSLLKDYFPAISYDDREKLTRQVSNFEILVALKDMKTFKAPGPDGFQALFYHKFWEVVQPNVTKLVKDVIEGREYPEGLTDAFLVLISKVDVPSQPNQFGPIGLCNIVYKLVTKVIVNRLKPVLPSLISPTQCSFVPKVSNNGQHHHGSRKVAYNER